MLQCSLKLIKLISGSFGFYIIMYKLEMKTYSLKLRANYLLVLVQKKSWKFSYVKLKILIFSFIFQLDCKVKVDAFVGCIWECFNSKYTILST